MRGATCLAGTQLCDCVLFQSTLPMRGATAVLDVRNPRLPISIHTPHAGSDHISLGHNRTSSYFNPHSPCGERRLINGVKTKKIDISIHTPHAGSDFTMTRKRFVSIGFQSTLPMRGATFAGSGNCSARAISIHTPHAGSDFSHPTCKWSLGISIHTPHAGSDQSFSSTNIPSPVFQSTLPMRGATGCGTSWGHIAGTFQSTLPMRGATPYLGTLPP